MPAPSTSDRRRTMLPLLFVALAACVWSCSAAAQGEGTSDRITIPLESIPNPDRMMDSAIYGTVQRQAAAVTPAANNPTPLAALPPDIASRHTLRLPHRTLSFTARAGAAVFRDDKDQPVAEIGYIAYLLDNADPKVRPLTFA